MSNEQKVGWYLKEMRIDGGCGELRETWEFRHSEDGRKCTKQGTMRKNQPLNIFVDCLTDKELSTILEES